MPLPRLCSVIYALLLSLMPVFICGCQARGLDHSKSLTFVGLKKIGKKDLRGIFHKYYLAESRHDWPVTYARRSRNFHQTVRFKSYVTSMKKSFIDWRLLKLKVNSFNCRGKICYMEIKFFESVSGSEAVKLGIDVRSISIHNETTKWKKIGPRWVVIDAGVRGHVPLNANMSDY